MATGQLPSVNKAGLGELFARLRFVVLAIIVYRIGTHIPVPGIDPNQLAALFNQNQDEYSGSGDHALHLCIDHHAVDVSGYATAGAVEERR